MTATTTDFESTTPRKSRRRTAVRALAATTLALGVAAAGGYVWLNQTSDVRNTGVAECTAVTPDGGNADELRAVCETIATMTAAWDRNDADAFGATFTENATYTTFLGTHYTGRRDLTDAHRALFSGFLKGTKLADSFLGVRFYGDDVAIVTSRGDRYEDERPAELAKTQTYTLVREADGQWRIASFHNTKRQSVMERVSFLFDPATKPEAER
ncbi:SgcJ/EcaC family oxidoreductase [Nocardia pneumoniae]|uniref:SgcJ/EcaC family oxidoreductase n=1 Tax=Nocardia pneumoniae TaxID=228601 RepID=UPI0002DE0ED0|nr:SgcJ/EcaC family oxidoreductase [Nocardia pneumoniae]